MSRLGDTLNGYSAAAAAGGVVPHAGGGGARVGAGCADAGGGLNGYAFEAIFQEEITSLWSLIIKPWLVAPQSYTLNLTGWQVVLLSVTAFAFPVLILIVRAYMGKQDRIWRKKMPLPEDVDEYEFNSTDIIKIIVAARKGEIDVETAIDLVVRAVNLKKIKPEAASEVLHEFGYDLIHLTDGTYKKAQRWQQ
jgi:hypothetical protein